jgi:hypothetical protein
VDNSNINNCDGDGDGAAHRAATVTVAGVAMTRRRSIEKRLFRGRGLRAGERLADSDQILLALACVEADQVAPTAHSPQPTAHSARRTAHGARRTAHGALHSTAQHSTAQHSTAHGTPRTCGTHTRPLPSLPPHHTRCFCHVFM